MISPVPTSAAAGRRPLLASLATLALGLLLAPAPVAAQSAPAAAPAQAAPGPPPSRPQPPLTRPSTLQTALILVGGQEMSRAEMEQKVNPQDIDRINVLKGEQALAKYGERGRAGVVEIIMKK